MTQRQDSLTDQMLDLAVFAKRLGMAEAHHFILSQFDGVPSDAEMKRPRKIAAAHESTPQGAKSLGYCGEPGKVGVCIRPPRHKERHRYGIPPAAPHTKPDRAWEKMKEIRIFSSGGQRTYQLAMGNPCRVKGQRGTWVVIGIEQHRDNGKVNVEVKQDRTGHSRTFPVEKVTYMRPKKAAS